MARLLLNAKAVSRALPETGQIELWDAVLPGFGLRISAGGARTYFVMRRLNGRLVRRTIGRAFIGDGPLAPGEYKLAEARLAAAKLLSDFQRGVDPRAIAREEADRVASAKMVAAANTFSAVAAGYFADTGRRGGGSLKSRRELERKVRVDLAEWHARPIDGITRADVKSVLRTKAATSPVAANRLLGLIRRILKWAVREEVLVSNVASELEPTPEVERERVLTLKELCRIWEASTSLGYPFGPIIKLLILTAQRRSEVAEMRWSELDGDDWRLPDSRAKRGKGHWIALSGRAVAIIATLPRIGEPAELVFSTGRRRQRSTSGERLPPAPVAGWSRAKSRLDRFVAEQAAKAAGEAVDPSRHELPPWTVHDIRRSVATHLRDNAAMGGEQVDRLTVSKILNHAEGGMTRLYDRYSAEKEQRAALEAWAMCVDQLTGENVIVLDELQA